jgi:hypothetical protein
LKPKAVEQLLCLKEWYQSKDLSCLNWSSVFFELFCLLREKKCIFFPSYTLVNRTRALEWQKN